MKKNKNPAAIGQSKSHTKVYDIHFASIERAMNANRQTSHAAVAGTFSISCKTQSSVVHYPAALFLLNDFTPKQVPKQTAHPEKLKLCPKQNKKAIQRCFFVRENWRNHQSNRDYDKRNLTPRETTRKNPHPAYGAAPKKWSPYWNQRKRERKIGCFHARIHAPATTHYAETAVLHWRCLRP